MTLRVALLVLGIASCRGSDVRSEAASEAPRPAEPASVARPLPRDLDVDDARHLLARFTFGARLGEPERVLAQGIEPWLEEQLRADAARDPLSDTLRQRYPLAFATPRELLEPRPAHRDPQVMGDPAAAAPRPAELSEVLFELQAAIVTRQTRSEHQLLEVMADFWLNHFNVNAAKGRVYLVAGQYLDGVIRRHALGTFEDLLVAVAMHPAMRMYLDNASGSERPGIGGRASGMNENYARELLELHTVGVDGGYSQRDVEEAARVLSGWRPVDLAVAYSESLHDPGPKVVMGRHFPAGGGMREAEELLRFLARHPSTVRHLSRKLAVRFVSDHPSEALVDRIADAWARTGGDIRSVLRAIVADPELWAEENRRTKVKTSLEWLVGAFRLLGVEPSDVDVRRVANRLGQAPYSQRVPTGYPEVATEWANGAQLSVRWQVAFQLARGHTPGVTYAAGDPLPREGSVEEHVRFVCDRLLGRVSPSTEQALRDHLAEAPNVEQRRILAVAMALSSPEFQRQ